MIGITVQKPDLGHVLAVRPNLTLVQGLGPVMNIILAYGTAIHYSLPYE
jgi:hypothetical protein